MTELNIYATPETDVTVSQKGPSIVIDDFKNQSTWMLVFLSIITLGIYLAHYMKRQTKVFNKHLDPSDQISEGFLNSIILLYYLSAFLLIPFFFLENGETIGNVSDLVDRIANIVSLVWAFKAKNRMVSILSAKAKEPNWFHGLWTFLFQAFYFNYKINKIKKSSPSLSVAPNP